MNNLVNNSVEYDEATTTKEELISRLSKRLAKAESREAWLKEKLTKGGGYLGFLSGDYEAAKAEARVAREVLDKVLAV